ncbi:MAG TPA: ATP-binding protein [Burkholderiaceae bacterium]|nr:ATP-binding protein [Burkholderiaceae bacterium]
MELCKTSDLQALRRQFGVLAFASLPSVATAGIGRPDTTQLLAAVCVGALIVLIAVAVAQRRRTPAPTAAPMASSIKPSSIPDANAGQVTQLQSALEQRERELAERTRELSSRVRELDNAGRELDNLAHSVSHDLRAPLRIVDGFATIVLEDYGDRGKPLDDLGRDHLRRIVAASQRMNSMIDTLLNLSRMTSRELANERVDLSQIARELADDLRDDLRLREPARSIEFVIAPGLKADGDPTLLRLVLQNLLGNATKFSAKYREARVEFGRREEAGCAEFFVRDNGAGFDMRFAQKMFGMFQRLHSVNEFPGTGVGLATVQKIIQRHGGRVWAEAVPAPAEGHGATFFFTLWEKA